MTLDRVLWELKQYLKVDPADGGTPYAYRFYPVGDLDYDDRLDAPDDAEMVEIRVFYAEEGVQNEYTITPTDAAGRHIAAPRPPERTDAVPMVIGDSGVAVPGAIRRPIPDEPPLEVLAEVAQQPGVDEQKVIESVKDPKRRRRLRRILVGE